MVMAIDAAGLGTMASGPKMTAARVTGTAGATARISSSSSSSVVDDIVLIDVRIRTTSLTIITAMALVKAMGARTHPTRSTNAWRTATSPAPATAAAAAAAASSANHSDRGSRRAGRILKYPSEEWMIWRARRLSCRLIRRPLLVVVVVVVVVVALHIQATPDSNRFDTRIPCHTDSPPVMQATSPRRLPPRTPRCRRIGRRFPSASSRDSSHRRRRLRVSPGHFQVRRPRLLPRVHRDRSPCHSM